MANLSRLSSIAGLAVAGSALGLYLGGSAISEINPAYYSTPLSGSAFHADLVPNAPDRDGDYALAPLGSGEIAGPVVPPDYLGRSDAIALGSDLPSPSAYRTAPAEIVLAEADRSVSSGLSADELRDIERYAHFQVSDDEARPRLSARSDVEAEAAACAPGDECEAESAPGI